MPLRTYYPNEVSLIAVGLPISGFAPGTFISVEKNEDAFTLQVGSDGEGCRTRTNNFSGRITFTLQQSSALNDALSALHNIDTRSPSGDGVLPSFIKDNSGRTLVAAENSWIVRQPTTEFANEAGTREWIIESDDLNMQVGGN